MSSGGVVTGNSYDEIRRFLHDEAALIDDGRLRDWLDLLTDDVSYRIPTRVTKDRGAETEFDTDSFHLNDDRYRLEKRIQRLETEYAWAEDPPSRTRHIISNIRVDEGDGDGHQVRSNFLLYRNRGDSSDHDLLAGERHDVIRRVDGQLKLAERVVELDQGTLSTHNISFFI